eukprot:scaffold14643_cov142-Skeletonema_dohrnii-CCMP3373.AAC.2
MTVTVAEQAPKAKRISASTLGVSLFRGDRSAEEGDDGRSSSDGRGGELQVLLLRLWMNCNNDNAACKCVVLMLMLHELMLMRQ